jgi:hypothetical protein
LVRHGLLDNRRPDRRSDFVDLIENPLWRENRILNSATFDM